MTYHSSLKANWSWREEVEVLVTSPAVAETPEGLAEVGGHRTLTDLLLIDTPVTDAGLGHIVELPRLSRLFLANTSVTDAGLLELARSRSLRSLQIMGNHGITPSGIGKLRRLRPDLGIGG